MENKHIVHLHLHTRFGGGPTSKILTYADTREDALLFCLMYAKYTGNDWKTKGNNSLVRKHNETQSFELEIEEVKKMDFKEYFEYLGSSG